MADKLSGAERRRRQHQRKNGGFYFNYDYDKAQERGKRLVKRNPIDYRTPKDKRGGRHLAVALFDPGTIPMKFKDLQSGEPVWRDVPQCRAGRVGTDPPIRCKKAALEGQDFCRSHGGAMLNINRERHMHKYSDEELRQQIENMTKGDLLDIKEEVAITVLILKKHAESILRAETEDIVDDDGKVIKKGLTNKDIELALKIIESIGKNVERLHKMRYGDDVITKEALAKKLVNRTKCELDIINSLVEDDDIKQKLLNEFANIKEEE